MFKKIFQLLLVAMSLLFVVACTTIDKTAINIEVVQPNKVIYEQNETIDFDGLIVYGINVSNEKWVIDESEYTVSAVSTAVVGDFEVIVTYLEFTASFTIVVNPEINEQANLIDISITMPNKLTYVLNETFNPTGLIVRKVYDDESMIALSASEYSVTGFSSVTKGVKTITVTYLTYSKTFQITVTDPTVVVSSLEILFINDFHGALEDDGNGRGMARIGQYLINQKNSKPDQVIVLSAGDMLQGTAISNLNFGRVVVESMNIAGFDAMTIGNHEFDWGVDKMIAFRDGNPENGEANFPWLAANIFERSTNTAVTWAEPYTIIERGGVKVGIIGVIGEGLTSSISPSISNPYQFKNPAPIVASIAKDLRTNHGVTVIVVNAHDGETNSTSKLNSDLRNLSGDERVDAIINSHTHYRYARTQTRSDNYQIPVVQAGSSGSHIGKIVIQIDPVTKNATQASGSYFEVDSSLAVNNPQIAQLIATENARIAPIINRVVATAGETMYSSSVADWSADVFRKKFDVDVGIINYGGIRSNAFPIYSNSQVTVAKMIEVLPFDNMMKTVTLTGTELLQAFRTGGTSLAYSSNVQITGSGSSLTARINGINVTANGQYTVAAVDYVFDQDRYPFINGPDIVTTGILARDVLIEELDLITSKSILWRPSMGAYYE